MPTLPQITSLARSGALDRAWALFREGGYEAAASDPAALAVKGRLLKDQAFRAEGAERDALLSQAEAAYGAADTLSPQPWLLINVATLAALRGAWSDAAGFAASTLSRIEQEGSTASETPYWLAATRAEAHLIRGEVDQADAALAQAVAHDPQNYDDHAVTLRQLERLIAARGEEYHWLDKHRPPASLHFAGHLGIAPEACAALRAQVDATLESSRIGFAYGALAAGSDIIVAEAVQARGGEVHAVLPAPVADFVELSVRPYGAQWVKRFEAVLAACASVHVAATVDKAGYEPLATALAAELAMGAALLNARQLQSRAHQLLIIDEGGGPYGGGLATARDGEVWSRTDQPQHIILAPRSAPVAPSSTKQEGRTDRELVALVRVEFAGLDDMGDAEFATALDDAVTPFWEAVAELPDQPFLAQPSGNARVLAFANVGNAARYVEAVRKPALQISAHYGFVLRAGDTLLGPALRVLEDIADMTLAGTVTVSENFATALALAADSRVTPESHFVADCPLRASGARTRLFTLAF
jgi:hypothetical protein